MALSIVFTVLWFASIGIGWWLFTALGALSAAAIQKVWPAPVGLVIGAAWVLFALYKGVSSAWSIVTTIWPHLA